MHVLLTGATGFLGYRTLEHFAHSIEITRITAVGRTIKSSHQVIHPKVTYSLGDLSDEEFVAQLFDEVDVVVHAAALSSPWGEPSHFHNANVLPMQHLINNVKGKNIKRFVYISTPSMYFDGNDRINIREIDQLPKRFINAYAATKRQAERLLEHSGLPFISLRPRALTGRGDTVIMPRLIRAYDEGRLKIIGNGKNVVDLTSVANVVDAIELSINAPETSLGKHYNITNGEPVLLWQKIDLILSSLGKTLTTKKIPYPLVKTIAQAMELRSKWTHQREPALTVYGVGTLAKSFTMDISLAREHLGYVPRVSTDEAIQEFVNWYMHHGSH
jgi:nucleoside-diphosphate-sugar epimerase